MTEKLNVVENSFDLEKDANPDDLKKLVKIIDSFYCAGDFESSEDLYSFDEIKSIRASLALLYPNLGFESDDQFYRILKTESQTFIDRKELEYYISNAIYRRIVFPEKNEELYREMEDLSMYETLLELLESVNKEDDIHETYLLARDIKLLYPEKFTEDEILKILGHSTWEERITQYVKELKEKSLEDYNDTITDLASAINIIGYPRRIQFKKKDWEWLKQYKDFFITENDYAGLAEYLMKMKTISAKEIKITRENILLIF
jgi:hypothetical protein